MNTSFERTKNGKDEWLTPPYIIDSLGVFDLDPCSPINRPWDTKADAILFLKGRLNFYNVDGTKGNSNAGAPSCLVAYRCDNAFAIGGSKIPGRYIYLK